MKSGTNQDDSKAARLHMCIQIIYKKKVSVIEKIFHKLEGAMRILSTIRWERFGSKCNIDDALYCSIGCNYNIPHVTLGSNNFGFNNGFGV
mmetsp:Transcript_1129/g.1849  ORF Transcript_1129/g.1849 Transcript_1129/m.1849 type:complete len:91 (-) Transcript_1129:40-312(-)